MVRTLAGGMAGCMAAAVLAGCTAAGQSGSGADEPAAGGRTAPAAGVTTPEVGTCRALPAAAVDQPDDDSPRRACRRTHTAETFAVGTFDDRFATATVADERLSAEVLRSCGRRFRRYVGADASLALRTVLTWAWFRPSPQEWEAGARWYRCDLVAEGSDGLLELRGSARDVLLGRPEDRWLLCAAGPQVSRAQRVPCDEPHDWRAVTTVVLGAPQDPYPGDRRVEVRTRDYCSDSVRAWLGYPVDFAYGYTWLGRAEWETGNRRSICWARTEQ